jgi:crotonobetainyl-CoA:carnitine CoA-transferase CaiB-like acyl-CoA transferase
VTNETSHPGPLRGIRVIDAANERGELAGRVLADLGATVLKVEPPGGSPSRRRGPFEKGHEQDAEGSLYWATVSLGKHSIVLDWDSPAGIDELLTLLRSADVFIESEQPGRMRELGLDYTSLVRLNASLIYTSITPFGQHGPMADAPASDLTVEAAGGLISLQGDGDRPPVPVGYPQASLHGGLQAAADIIVALNERAVSGLGQYLDVSQQAAMVWTLMHATGYPPQLGTNPPNTCEARNREPVQLIPGIPNPPRLWSAKDGWIMATPYLGLLGARTLNGLMRWMEEDDLLPEELRGIQWTTWSADVAEGSLAIEKVQQAIAYLPAFFATKTKRELMDRAIPHSLLLAPINTVADVRHDPQLEARGYWESIEGRSYPGHFARFSRTPLRMGAPAHLGAGAPQEWGDRDRRTRPASSRADGAFAGLRVADFAWVGAAPIVTRALADHGATVVHIESTLHLDTLRNAPPYKDGIVGYDRTQFMADFNSSKLGLACDLGTEKGRELAKKVVAWADVVVESFTPGTLAKLGLGWDDLSKGRPDLIMMSSCLRGQTGPERTYGGFGGQGAALAGLHGITGWPDRPPWGPWGAYTDFIAPRYSLVALASAIFERRASGLGQYIDVSQVECGIHFLEPLLLDYEVNGRIALPPGHDSALASPHGVFQCAGEERHMALSVENEAQWRALCSIAPLGAFRDSRFNDLEHRRKAGAAIEEYLRAWCAGRDAFALAARLRASGVPAYAVMRPTDLYDDPQLAHRGFFVKLAHTVMGPTPYDGAMTNFSGNPFRMRKAAPCLGEDTHHIMSDLLGLSDDQITEYASAGALT